jgi:hypothetical protein
MILVTLLLSIVIANNITVNIDPPLTIEYNDKAVEKLSFSKMTTQLELNKKYKLENNARAVLDQTDLVLDSVRLAFSVKPDRGLLYYIEEAKKLNETLVQGGNVDRNVTDFMEKIMLGTLDHFYEFQFTNGQTSLLPIMFHIGETYYFGRCTLNNVDATFNDGRFKAFTNRMGQTSFKGVKTIYFDSLFHVEATGPTTFINHWELSELNGVFSMQNGTIACNGGVNVTAISVWVIAAIVIMSVLTLGGIVFCCYRRNSSAKK